MSEKGKRKEKNQEKSLKNRKNPVILSGNIEKWYILKMENTCKKKLFGVQSVEVTTNLGIILEFVMMQNYAI